MGEQNSNATAYKRKGWKGYVHSYKTYTENGNYEKVKWNKKTTAKKVEEKDDGRKVYHF